jgi:hypothetical protein
MSFIHFAAYSLISFLAISSSNLDCITEKLLQNRILPENFKQDLSIWATDNQSTWAIESISSNEENTNNSSSSSLRLVEELITSVSINLAADRKKFSKQVCEPALIEKGLERFFSVYLCNRFLAQSLDSSIFMMNHKDIMGKNFSKVFLNASAGISKSFQEVMTKSDQTDSFSTSQENESISNHKSTLDIEFDTFSKNVEEEFKVAIMEIYMGKSSEQLEIAQILSESMPGPSSDFNIKIERLILIFTLNFDVNSNETVISFRNALESIPELVSEPLNSESFKSIDSVIMTKMNQAHKLPPMIPINMMYTSCYEALASYEVESPVSKCDSLLLIELNFEDLHSVQFKYLLGNTSFVKAVNHILKKRLIVFKSQSYTDLSDTIGIKEDILVLIRDNTEQMNISKLGLSVNLSVEFSPLIWDFRNYISSDRENFFRSEEIQLKFKEYSILTANHCYSSMKQILKIDELKANIVNALNIDKTKIEKIEFTEKLSSQCKLLSDSRPGHWCSVAAKDLSIGKNLLKTKSSESIFKLITDLFQGEVAHFDFDQNLVSDLEKQSYLILQKIITDLEAQIVEVLENLPKSLISIKKKVITRIFIEANIANLALRKDFKIEIWTISLTWIEQNAQEIIALSSNGDNLENLITDFKTHLITSFKLSLFDSEIERSIHHFEQKMTSSHLNQNQEHKNVLKEKIVILLKHFHNFPRRIKEEIAQCKLNRETIAEKLAICSKENKASCRLLNPFVVIPGCPSGFYPMSTGDCRASCPDNYSSFSEGYCSKPKIQFLAAALGKTGSDDGSRCKRNFTKIGFMCVPRCPNGWRDFGTTCKQPTHHFPDERLILLIN